MKKILWIISVLFTSIVLTLSTFVALAFLFIAAEADERKEREKIKDLFHG